MNFPVAPPDDDSAGDGEPKTHANPGQPRSARPFQFGLAALMAVLSISGLGFGLLHGLLDKDPKGAYLITYLCLAMAAPLGLMILAALVRWRS